MATIRRRDDKWQVQVRRKGFRPASRTFDQQRDAERWGTLKEREYDALESQGLLGAEPCDLTLSQLLKRYREKVVIKKRSASREEYIVRVLERAAFASKLADRVTPSEIKAHRDRRMAVASPATVVRELGVLQHAYHVAQRDWGFEGLKNPVAGITRPALPRGRQRRLTGSDEEALRQAIATTRNDCLAAIVAIALETGMRLSEITSARWEHFNADERVLTLPITKNGKPRTVPLSKRALEAIQSRDARSSGLIFPTTSEAIKRAWIRLVRRACVSDLHFHDLRHEAISRLFERGLDMPEVMLMSGHTDHRMLLRYTHLNARRLIAKLDACSDPK